VHQAKKLASSSWTILISFKRKHHPASYNELHYGLISFLRGIRIYYHD
jgi:hypothetical protein